MASAVSDTFSAAFRPCSVLAMRYLLGTDEAGYGPNLGPLVVAASAWELRVRFTEGHVWSCSTSPIPISTDPEKTR